MMHRFLPVPSAFALVVAFALAGPHTPAGPPPAAAAPGVKPRAWIDSTLVGADVHGAGRHVHCRFFIADKHPRLHKPIHFVARLTYTGPDSIYLPTAYSRDARTMMPRAWIMITGTECAAPPGTQITVNDEVRPLDEQDFRLLHTGESMYYGAEAGGDSVATSHVDYLCAGVNHVEFHYQTHGVTAHTWLLANSDRPSDKLVAILRRVPHVDVFGERRVRVRP